MVDKQKGSSLVDVIIIIVLIFIFASAFVKEVFYEVRCEFGSDRACDIVEGINKPITKQPEIIVEPKKPKREVTYHE